MKMEAGGGRLVEGFQHLRLSAGGTSACRWTWETITRLLAPDWLSCGRAVHAVVWQPKRTEQSRRCAEGRGVVAEVAVFCSSGAYLSVGKDVLQVGPVMSTPVSFPPKYLLTEVTALLANLSVSLNIIQEIDSLFVQPLFMKCQVFCDMNTKMAVWQCMVHIEFVLFVMFLYISQHSTTGDIIGWMCILDKVA